MELLTKVEQAEEAAEERRAAGQREAREILKAVEEATLAERREAELANRDLTAGVLADARDKVQQEIAATQRAGEAGRTAQREQAMQRLDKAAAIIFERVVNDGHR